MRAAIGSTIPKADVSLSLTTWGADGVTEYIALPLQFTDGTLHTTSWAMKEPGGAVRCVPSEQDRKTS